MINDEYPVGTVIMYNGTDIPNPSTRNSDLSSFGLPGWYVCNGNNGTTNLSGRFIRMETSVGNTGGSNNTSLIEHNHSVDNDASHDHDGYTDYNGQHRHDIDQDPYFIGSQGLTTDKGFWGTCSNYCLIESVVATEVETTSSDGSHSHTLQSNGSHTHGIDGNGSVNGTNDNIPKYYETIFIKRMA